MKPKTLLGAMLFLLLIVVPAHGSVILDVTGALSLGDPAQLGRLSRNGIPQDWSGGEAFPGVINPTTAYHYHTYVVNVGLTPFVQIIADSLSLNTFVSAYDTAYLPNSAAASPFGFNTNWLGDGGLSGNFFPADPLFFQVLVPVNHNLVIVINNTTAENVGIGDPFHLIVEGYIDSEFTDPISVPEPTAVVLVATGLALMAARWRFMQGKRS